MISSRFFTTIRPPLTLILLIILPLNTLYTCMGTPTPAGVEAILDIDQFPDIGDLVQVAPSLALHQEEAEKASIKSIKTPSGTVKCSCQTVLGEGDDEQDEDADIYPNDPTKTIEIEIYKPDEEEADSDEDSAKEEDSAEERESHLEKGDKKPPAFVRNSFTLDGEDASSTVFTDTASSSPFSQDRVYNTEERTSFLSFLSSLVSSSAQAQAQALSSQPETKLPQDLRTNKPDKIGTEAEQESEQEYEDENDDLASLNGDVNVQNHRMFDTVASEPVVSASSPKTVYKAFRTADLIGAHPVQSSSFHASSGVSNNEKMDSVGDKNVGDKYFLWDFIYANSAAGKKRELLQLGTVTDPFIGPRRRRRRRRSLRGNGNNSPVVFVYPVGYQPTSASSYNNEDKENEVIIPENETKAELTNHKVQVRSGTAAAEVELDKDEVQRAMHAAMEKAWEQYGPKGLDAPPVTPAPPTQFYVIPESQLPPVPPFPGQKVQPKNRPQQERPRPQSHPSQQDLVYYTPPRPFLFIDRIFNPFQPMTSEWDKHVTTFQGPAPPLPEPGIFSRFLASYIDFEVNNHEAADLMRKVVFGIFVGFLIAGWIALGAALGIVPFKKLLAFVAGTHYDGTALGAKRNDKGKEFMLRDTTLTEITDKILLSLDADWLKRLEDRVMGSGAGGGVTSSGTKIPTRVFCCILPDEEANGMVECQVTKSGGVSLQNNNRKKTSAFKCISDLIYNFHFGPREDEEIEVEEDNIVNVKSKANNRNASVEGKPSGEVVSVKIS